MKPRIKRIFEGQKKRLIGFHEIQKILLFKKAF